MNKLIIIFILATITLSMIMQPAVAFAAENSQAKESTVDYIKRDILHFDPIEINCKEPASEANDSVPAPITENARQFTKAYAQAAINIGNEYGIPPLAILAQAALESGYGQSSLTREAYNFFGIKADSNWKGPVWTGGTREEYNGQSVNITAAFRKYPNAEEGFKGYGEFIHDNPRYKNALKYPNDPVRYITEIKKAGYATASNYISVNLGIQKSIQKILNDLNINVNKTTDSADGSTIKPDTPEAKVWIYFQDKGLSSTQIAAIMGNLKVESGFDPSAINGSSGAYGLAQWLGTRKTNLENYINSHPDKKLLEQQLEFMWKSELNGSYKASTLIPLQKADNLSDAVEIFLKKYEGPCSDEACYRAELKNRLKEARAILDKYGDSNTVQKAYNEDGCSSQNTDSSSSTSLGGYGYDIKSSTKKMVYYSQTDKKWKNDVYSSQNPPDPSQTIGSSGCGIVSISMVVETLTDSDFKPPEAAGWAVKNGFRTYDSGTSASALPAAAEKFNLNYSSLGTNLNEVEKVLKKGGLVIASVGPGTFTTQGHYIVIRKVDGNKFYIADPLSKDGITKGESNKRGYTAEELLNQGGLKGAWGFTK